MFGKILVVALLAILAWGAFAHTSGGAGPKRTYVVKAHDTLWAIAAANYDGDPREGVWLLQRRNRLGSTLLHPGQRLALP